MSSDPTFSITLQDNSPTSNNIPASLQRLFISQQSTQRRATLPDPVESPLSKHHGIDARKEIIQSGPKEFIFEQKEPLTPFQIKMLEFQKKQQEEKHRKFWDEEKKRERDEHDREMKELEAVVAPGHR